MDNTILSEMLIFLVAACVVVPLSSRARLGSVLGYLAAGVLIGPFGLGLISNAEQIMHVAEFGVIMMLFLIGLELDPATLWRLRKSIIGLGSIQVIATSAALTLAAVTAGLTWQAGLAVAMALTLSSTALALQMLQEKNLMQTSIGETSFSVLLFQDIAVIAMLVLLPLLAATGGDISSHVPTHAPHLLSSLPAWQQTVAVALIIGGVIVAGHTLIPVLFHIMAKTHLPELFTAASLTLLVGITLLMNTIGMSPALGAFIAGVVLTNSPYKRTLETDIQPFKGLLLGLFFISVGMGMDFTILASQPATLLLCVTALVIIKAAILYALGRGFGLSNVHTAGFALALSQGGEFAFVLLNYCGVLQIISPTVSSFLTLVVALSMATTPFLMLFYSHYIVPRFMSAIPARSFDTIDEQGTVILAGYGRFGQIIGRFIRAQGVSLTVLEKDPDQVELLRKFGVKGFFGDAARLDLLKSAGADNARLLIIAVDDADTCLEIARIAHEEFPALTIFARARNRRHAYELHKIGVTYFKRETFDSSLAMAQEVMVFLGKSREETARKAEAFKQHDEETLKHSFAFFDEEPELISFTRQAAGELENILRDDSHDASTLKHQ
jgi:glutathione-regulated potassium-efflux system ancillary protein KefC